MNTAAESQTTVDISPELADLQEKLDFLSEALGGRMKVDVTEHPPKSVEELAKRLSSMVHAAGMSLELNRAGWSAMSQKLGGPPISSDFSDPVSDAIAKEQDFISSGAGHSIDPNTGNFV